MKSSRLPVGSYVRIQRPDLQAVVSRLRELGYRTVGPRVVDSAIVYDDLDRVEDLPIGYLDRQDGGLYRLEKQADDAYFDYVVGPHSLKNYLFPPRDRVLEAHREAGQWQMQAAEVNEPPLAVIGVRSCDLHALRIQDRVFLGGDYVDTAYQARRERLFLVAVNCRRAADTCFCHSMNTGPAVQSGFDLSLTELNDQFVVEVGSELGGEVILAADWSPCAITEVDQARQQPRDLKQRMHQRASGGGAAGNSEGDSDGKGRGRQMETAGIRELLLENLEHPRWQTVAERCLSCANCTMVCPTCFCSSVEEVSDLTGDHVVRERSWASCFTAEHSYMNSGAVRKSTASRYRQWLTHKLATWYDQFDTSGCVGCGRCITWCPVGIDLTEEVAAIRGDQT